MPTTTYIETHTTDAIISSGGKPRSRVLSVYPTPIENLLEGFSRLREMGENYYPPEGRTSWGWFEEIITHLNTHKENLFASSSGFVFWVVYSERDQTRSFSLHHAERAEDVSFARSAVSTSDQTSYSVVITLFDDQYTIPLANLMIPIIYETSLLSKLPAITTTSDYTDRDYEAAFSAMKDIISQVEPELGQLLSAPGSADSLVLDTQSYLYDRIQLYIDLSHTFLDPDKASGIGLQVLARYLGYEPTPPLPAKFDLPVYLYPAFTTSLYDYLRAKSSTKKTRRLEDVYNTPDKSLGVKYSLDLSALAIDSIPQVIKFGDREFLATGHPSIIEGNLKATRGYDLEQEEPAKLSYYQGHEVTESFTLRTTSYSTLPLSYSPVDPLTVEVTTEVEDLSIQVVRTSAELFSVFNTAAQAQPSDEVVLPVFVSVNREGRASLIFLPSPTSDTLPNQLTIAVTYRVHAAEDGSGLVATEEKIYDLHPKDQSQIVSITYAGYEEDITISDLVSAGNWTASQPIAYWKISPLNATYGGYEGDTDLILRETLKTYASPSKLETLPASRMLKRAVVEEDYELILKNWQKFKILQVSVKPHFISYDMIRREDAQTE